MKTYLASYRYQGAEWCIDLQAESFEDAEARLAALRFHGRVDGELKYRAPESMGPVVRLVTALQNLLRRIRQ